MNTTCSYCSVDATYEGTRLSDGTLDGDFYCEDHKGCAPATPTKIMLKEPKDFTNVQRGVVRVGDTVISSHYGEVTVKEIQGCGKFCKSVVMAECDDHHVGFVFEAPGDHYRGERYSRSAFILRKTA